MYKIQTLNAISDIIRRHLGGNYTIAKGETAPDAVLVRSASMLNTAFPPSLLAIARAGAGVNNIPLDRCSAEGICVFNTPGANANAVCELVIAGLLLGNRDIVGGIAWIQGEKGKGTDVPKIVEKGKAAFAGPELRGKQLGIVGLGAIGVLVANAAIALGMDVVGYDPAISVEHAWGLSSTARRASSLDGLLASSDYVTLHLPLNEKTRGLFGADALAKMKATAVLLNYARAELVDSDALLTAVAARKLRGYVTDFPTDEMLGVEHVLPIPHLGASTPESEDNCADMAAAQLRDYLETGAIRNSVNLPDVALAAPAGKPRVTVIHQNIPNMLAAISSAAGKLGINISDMTNRSRGNIAYTVLDLDDGHAAVSGLCATLAAIEGVIRVRVI